MTLNEVLEAIAAHRDSFSTVPVGGWKPTERALFEFLERCCCQSFLTQSRLCPEHGHLAPPLVVQERLL